MKGKILTIAGSDPSGGAGIQADIKTISSLGGYAMTAITAITVQNTNTVSEVFEVPSNIVKSQIIAVLGDIGVDVIKTGMLLSLDIIQSLSDVLRDQCNNIPLVVDPVMVSTSGGVLLNSNCIDALISDIFPKSLLLTPNLAEASKLTGIELLRNLDDMRRAADNILKMAENLCSKSDLKDIKTLYQERCDAAEDDYDYLHEDEHWTKFSRVM
jgi:hydroxymethylpyrimidine/phosphomethylpyrimidine kinase